MTSPRRHPDRAGVFERDEHACRRCGATDDAADLRVHPVGTAVPERDDVDHAGDDVAVHESALVTVCASCLATLRAGPDASGPRSIADDELFSSIRATTQRQGAAISDVASLATVATALPGALESAADGSSTAGDGDEAADAVAAFVDARREVALALEGVDARLARLEGAEPEVSDGDESGGGDEEVDVGPHLAAFLETATALQADLRAVVELTETVANGVGLCHGCGEAFESSSADRCSVCGLERVGPAWPRDAGGADADGRHGTFESLCTTINARLTGTADRTEELTERTTALAEGLVARGAFA
ncbi:HNH endonuclease [Natrialbaceae archaeon GCM10025810]|uniref:HNH endonuclease n=1 Tax=Halovalidus salilacus TaxID=3075124 RepID=UPI003616AA53